VPHLADRAVAIVGRHFDQDGNPARTVSFKRDLFVRDSRQLAGAALDGALDVVGGHVLRLGRGHRSAQPGFFSGSPPLLAAMVISFISRVKILPRLASSAPFLCLIVAHLEWPDMREPRMLNDFG